MPQVSRMSQTLASFAAGAMALAASAAPVGLEPPMGHAAPLGPETADAVASSGYFYGGDWVELPLDTTRVAVARPAAEATAAVTAACSRLGGAPREASHVQAVGIEGWSLVELPLELRTPENVARVVEAVAGAGAFTSPVFVDSLGGPLIVPPALLIGITPGAEEAGRARLEALGRIAVRSWPALPGLCRVEAPWRSGFQALHAANALTQFPEIAFAEPDAIFTGRGALFPDDPLFSLQWGLHNTGQFGGIPGQDMDAPEAWDITTGSAGIHVVVLETGIQLNHPDLNLAPGRDFTGRGGSGGPVGACDNHGTPVAGCVSAIIDNGTGVAGLAGGCLVAPAKTFVSTTSCTGAWTAEASWTVDALVWAADSGARVTNNSNIYGFTSSAIAQAYLDTRDAGVVHFACAGNSGAGSLAWPAVLPGVNSVAALSPSGVRTSFSQYGTGLDFSAPGVSIVTTDRTGADGWGSGDYVEAYGTSFASPYAAAVAALVLSRNPNLSSEQVEEVLQQTSADLGSPGYDTGYGWGFVKAAAAVSAVCFGDCDADGSLTFFDFLCYQDRFASAGAGADCDGDGDLTFFDFLCFQNEFAAGCP